MARPATTADANAYAQRYAAAKQIVDSYWLRGSAPPLPAELIAAWLKTPGYRGYVSDDSKGYIITRPQPEASGILVDGQETEELFFWITDMGLSKRVFLKALADPFAAWFKDIVAERGDLLCWGIVPLDAPRKDHDYVKLWIPAQEPIESGGMRWIRYKGMASACLEGMRKAKLI